MRMIAFLLLRWSSLVSFFVRNPNLSETAKFCKASFIMDKSIIWLLLRPPLTSGSRSVQLPGVVKILAGRPLGSRLVVHINDFGAAHRSATLRFNGLRSVFEDVPLTLSVSMENKSVDKESNGKIARWIYWLYRLKLNESCQKQPRCVNTLMP